MSELFLILRYRGLALWRRVWEDFFSIAVMGPLIIGGTGWVLQSILESAGRALREGADSRVSEHSAALAGAIFGILAIARLSNAVRDLYSLDPADHFLEALPVKDGTLFHAAVAERIVSTIPILAVAHLAVYLAAEPGTTLMGTLRTAGPGLVIGALTLAVFESALAVLLVRFRLLGATRLALAAAATVTLAALAVEQAGWYSTAVVLPSYAVARLGFSLWRTEDRELAREALARARRTGLTFERLADKAFGAAAGAQVMRDLRLVRRGFSSTVYVAAGIALVVPALASWIVTRHSVTIEGGLKVVEGATVVGAFALASIVHALAHYERPRVWIDVTCGVERREFPRAKRWTGRILAAPAALIGVLAAFSAGLPVDIAEVGKMCWLAWAAGSLTSVLCYEAEGRASLAIAFAFVAAVGITSLFVVYPAFWPIWFFGYYYASTNIFDRATVLAPGAQ